MKSYVVGGAVRDELLGLQPKDFDYVVVGATPADMLAAGFTQVGADFPVFLHPKTGEEYALARVERKSGKGYLGFEVRTENVSLKDDLQRRDLTINAMARDLKGTTLFDPFHGQDDLKNKVLRHVSASFAEDPLRVIRLCRFYARYSDFVVAPETFNLAFQMVKSGQLNELAVERFWAELSKVFTEEKPERFFELAAALELDVHVNFFSGLYYALSLDGLRRISDQAKEVQRLVPVERRLRIHTALAAQASSTTIETADSDTRTLHERLNLARSTRRVVDEVFEFLKRSRLWNKNSIAEQDLFHALFIASKTREFAFTPGEFTDLIHFTSKVTAADFPHLAEGKELGKAIESGRKDVIAGLLFGKTARPTKT